MKIASMLIGFGILAFGGLLVFAYNSAEAAELVYLSLLEFLRSARRVDFPIWIISQFFAYLALIFSVWAWQVKNKIKMMFLVGMFSLFLVISATLLWNYSLGVLFGLAAIRNFVFCFIDWRVAKGRKLPSWLAYAFAVVFAILTITATALLWHTGMTLWLELLICATLLGLIVGNILKGTNLMRCSFIANRAFNIINHAYFMNVIAVFIAFAAIGSNLVFYLREFIAWMKKRKSGEVVAEN